MEYRIADIRRFPPDAEILCRAEAKKRQVDRYLSEEAKKRTLLGVYTAKQLLAHALRCPAKTLELEYTEAGKPYLPGSRQQVSISHSGDKVLCAAQEGPVGADIEYLRPFDARLIPRICTPAERAYIGGDPVRFFSVWTAKEAYLKLTGLGLAGGMKQVQAADENGLYRLIQGYRLQTFRQGEYLCAIVYQDQ